MPGHLLQAHPLAHGGVTFYVSPMAKIARNSTSGQFTVSSSGGKRTTIRNAGTGQVLGLKGYGALKGEFAVKKGIDLSKPIAAQAKSIKSAPGARAK
jgi:hypothetical protein